MAEVLAVLGISTLVMAAVVLAAGAWVFHRLRRRNRVSARDRSAAPLTWLASPWSCARLHRRLRTAVIALRASIPSTRRRRQPPTELAALTAAADEVEAQAVALDRELVVAARLRGPTADGIRRRLAQQVGEVERVITRLAVTAAGGAGPTGPVAPTTPTALREVDERLDALDAARREVARLEAAVGLVPAAPSAIASAG